MSRARDTFEEQFQRSYVGLSNVEPVLFIKSQWTRQPTNAYAIYRWIIALSFIVWISCDYWKTTDMFYGNHPLVWLIYATNWSLSGLLVVNVFHAIICTYYRVHPERLKPEAEEDETAEGSEEVPFVLMIFWGLHGTFSNLAIVVSVCFWTFIIFLEHGDQYDAPISKVKHTLNTVYVIIDLLISANPVRIFHVVYPLVGLTIYIIFDTIYIAAGGRGQEGRNFIYQELRWNVPIEALITIMLTFILVLASQLILFTFYEIRGCIYSRISREGVDSTPLLKSVTAKSEGDIQSKYNSTDDTDLLTTKTNDLEARQE